LVTGQPPQPLGRRDPGVPSSDPLPQVAAAIGRPSPSSHRWGARQHQAQRPSPVIAQSPLALDLCRLPPDPASAGSSDLGSTSLLAAGAGNSAGSLGLGSGASTGMVFRPALSRPPPSQLRPAHHHSGGPRDPTHVVCVVVLAPAAAGRVLGLLRARSGRPRPGALRACRHRSWSVLATGHL
jgi:hypothetical protein